MISKLIDYNTRLTNDDRCDIANYIEELQARNEQLIEALVDIATESPHKESSNIAEQALSNQPLSLYQARQAVIAAGAKFVADSYRPEPKYDAMRFDALDNTVTNLKNEMEKG